MTARSSIPKSDYTIPRKIRELQLMLWQKYHSKIIPYQEKLGNYNVGALLPVHISIIPYQEKLGNYNSVTFPSIAICIIPYQEKLGNYNSSPSEIVCPAIIPYQEKSAPSPKVAAPIFGAQKSIFHVFWVYHIFLFFAKKPAPTVFRQGCFSVLRFDFKQVAELNSASSALRNSVHFHPIVDL